MNLLYFYPRGHNLTKNPIKRRGAKASTLLCCVYIHCSRTWVCNISCVASRLPHFIMQFVPCLTCLIRSHLDPIVLPMPTLLFKTDGKCWDLQHNRIKMTRSSSSINQVYAMYCITKWGKRDATNVSKMLSSLFLNPPLWPCFFPVP